MILILIIFEHIEKKLTMTQIDSGNNKKNIIKILKRKIIYDLLIIIYLV